MAEVAGWYGAIACLFAYAAVSYGVLEPASVTYQLLNISSALGVVWLSYEKKIFQTAFLNIIWAIIGVVALIRIVLI